MENVACNVIYVDRSVSQDRHVRARDLSGLDQTEPSYIAENVKLLLEVFDGGMHAPSALVMFPSARRPLPLPPGDVLSYMLTVEG